MIYGALEIEIMNSIWTLQEADEDRDISVADIVENLNNNEVSRAYTTVKTVMDRLVTKEILVRYKAKKKFFYRSTITRNEASKEAVRTISYQFFNGDYDNMIRFVEKEFENVMV